jgi:hypothetical protein
MDQLIVPSSMQRIRAFLVEMCGMKVKPWAGAEETLAALHVTLVARQSCDIFWDSLRTLMQTLARDLKARKSAEPGTLLDNEVLSDERYASLLDEIRACLAKQASEPRSGAFRQLAQGLSAPALGLLLLLGGVTTAGCDSSSLRATTKAPDAAVADAPPDKRADSGQDNSIVINLPDVLPAKRADSGQDNSIVINLPDVPPAKPDLKDARYAVLDGAPVTIQDIMQACNISSDLQKQVLACLANLRDSWTTGIADALTGDDCTTVYNQLECFPYGRACMFGSNQEFDPAICLPVPVYIGVRFV